MYILFGKEKNISQMKGFIFYVFFLWIFFVVGGFLLIFYWYRTHQVMWRIENPPPSSSSPHGTTIPKLIFQTWKSKHDVPALYQNTRRETQRLHPHYQFLLWDDEDNRRFIQDYYPSFLSVYDEYDQPIKRVDAVRYFFLYHFGGIYMDLDSVALRSFDPLMEGKDCLFGCQYPRGKDAVDAVPNCFMASVPRHPFFEYVIHQLKHTRDLDVLRATGPVFLTSCLRKWHDPQPLSRIRTIVPFGVLYTHTWKHRSKNIDWDDYRDKYPGAYATTLWTASWM